MNAADIKRLLKKYNRELEEVNCNLCGGRQTKTIWKIERFGTGLPAVMCKKCGLIYLNPRWIAQGYAQFYKEDYRKLMGEGELDAEEAFRKQLVHAAKILDFNASYIGMNKRILDVGSGAGAVLWLFREILGATVIGIEPTLKYQTFSRDILKIRVLDGIIENLSFEPASLDLVIMTQVLNHLLDPIGVLHKINKALCPNGLLFLEVQNFPECTKAMVFPTQIDHTYYFTPTTVEALANRAGYLMIKAEVDTASFCNMHSDFIASRIAPLHMRMLLKKHNFSKPLCLSSSLEVERELKKSILGYRRLYKMAKGYLAQLYKRLK